MPVTGTRSPRTALQWGSWILTSSADSSFSPCTPLSMPRWWIDSSRGISSASVATTTLPQRSCAIPLMAQNSYISRWPSVHRRALNDPGL